MSHLTTSARIFNALKRRPRSGVANFMLAGITLRYGARIKDLRDQGVNIQTTRISTGTYMYRILT